uniref:Uncharacterized protein n=1 Tax=Rhizophagus irregularis (strain DAOM 181602 / DAOM 197198 / MUCL 43194) TaxID=747089 RepID=U9SX55_RHIID
MHSGKCRIDGPVSTTVGYSVGILSTHRKFWKIFKDFRNKDNASELNSIYRTRGSITKVRYIIKVRFFKHYEIGFKSSGNGTTNFDILNFTVHSTAYIYRQVQCISHYCEYV